MSTRLVPERTGGQTPVLLRRLHAVHDALEGAGFDHAVGGAIALAVHVLEPRFTADIDLNVTADADDPDALLRCLPAEIDVPPTSASELRSSGQTRVTWPEPATPVDLFLPQHPTYHRLVVDRAQPVDFLGRGIKVLTATDLMVFKTLFSRSKDWVDIEELLRAGAGDVTEAKDWIRTFLGPGDARIERLDRLSADVAGRDAG